MMMAIKLNDAAMSSDTLEVAELLGGGNIRITNKRYSGGRGTQATVILDMTGAEKLHRWLGDWIAENKPR